MNADFEEIAVNLITRSKTIYLSDSHAANELELYLFITSLSEEEFSILSQLFFEPIRIQLQRFARSLDVDMDLLLTALSRFEKIGLLRFEEEYILVDKEMRRHLEIRLTQFDEDFKADFEFLHQLLRKVPIESLVHWYPISRSSENFFTGLISRYLETPQIYLRHLKEVASQSPVYQWLIHQLTTSPTFEIPSDLLKSHFSLSRQEVVETLISFEFHLAGTTKLSFENGHLNEKITLFDEIKTYLQLRQAPNPVLENQVNAYRPTALSFTEEMAAWIEKKGMPSSNDSSYTERMKTVLLQCRFMEDGALGMSSTPLGRQWAAIEPQRRALALTRCIDYSYPFSSPHLATEKNLRELDKILVFVPEGWILVEDFVKLVAVSLETQERFKLRKQGKAWHYLMPPLTEEEKEFTRETCRGPLFEGGLIELGFMAGLPVMQVTPFGRWLYPFAGPICAASDE